jgi:hypothetical protein
MKTMQARLAWSSPGDGGENELAPGGLKTTKYMLPQKKKTNSC